MTGLWRDMIHHERRETLPQGFSVVARWSVNLRGEYAKLEA